jgi:raffinose/stachyose/melibiose transport system substrate-binding protein
MKRMVVLFFALAFVLSLGACSTSTTPPAATSAPAQTQAASAAPATPAPAEKVSITFANYWVKQNMNGITYPLDLIDAWQKANPNVTLTLDSHDSSNYQNTYFKTMVAAGNLPQVFMLNSMDIRSTVANNFLMDITDQVKSDSTWYGSFLPGVFGETTVNDKIYAVPDQFITNECIFYNTDLLKANGFDAVPADWEGFLAMCEKLKGASLIPMAFGDKEQWPLCSNLMEIMCEYMAGKQWVDDIGAYNGKASYDTPEFISVLNLIKDFNDKGYWNSDMLSVSNFNEVYTYLNQKKAAMYLGGSYCLSGLYQNLSADLKDKFAVAPIPRPAAAKADFAAGIYTGGSGWELAVNAKATPAEAAAGLSLIKMITGTEYAKNAVENMSIPVLKMDTVTGWDASKVPQLQQLMNTSISQAPIIRLMNEEQSGPAMSNIIYKDLQNMITGSMTPEQTAKDIEAAYVTACASTAK